MTSSNSNQNTLRELKRDDAAGKCIAAALARERKRRMARAASDNSTFTTFLQSSFHDFAVFLVDEVRAERNQVIADLAAQVQRLRGHIQEAQEKYVSQGPAGVVACMRENARLLAETAPTATVAAHYIDVHGAEMLELLKIASETGVDTAVQRFTDKRIKNSK